MSIVNKTFKSEYILGGSCNVHLDGPSIEIYCDNSLACYNWDPAKLQDIQLHLELEFMSCYWAEMVCNWIKLQYTGRS